MKNKIFIALIICAFLPFNSSLYAKEYKAAVTKVATVNILTELLNAIGEATGNTFNIQTVPRARAIYLIENKQVDLQVPNFEIPDPAKQKELKYDYSSITTYKICYILYSNKDKNINVAELKNGNPKKYLIEADNSLLNFFTFTSSGSTNLEGSLKKVDMGRIDGCIYAQTSGDPALKKLGLKNIKRELYSFYNSKFSIPKGTKGGEVDRMLTDGINKLKSDGRYDKIISGIIKTGGVYNDWQP